MSYPIYQAPDDEPVTRGRNAPVPEDEEDFVLPRRGRARGSSAHLSVAPAAPLPLDSKKVSTSARSASRPGVLLSRFSATEHWIVKRGHFFSYLGLFLFTFILYFRPYELIPSLASFSSMAQVAALLTLGIYVPSQVMLEGNFTTRPREVNLLLLLTLFALLSIPLAINPGDGWEAFNDPFIKVVLMFIVMINVTRTEARLKGLILLSLAVSFYLSLSALDNYRAGNFTVEGYRVEAGVGGMFANPNDMALHLVTMTPITLALMFATRNIFLKALYGACVALMIAGNVVTFSRGGFLGLACAVGMFAWKVGRKHRLAVVVFGFIALAVFVALAPGNYGVRLLSVFDSGLDPVGSSSMRRELLIRSVIVALRHPLLGIGMNNFHIVSIHEHVSHNAYTQVAAEMGMTALALYTLFIITPFKRLRQIERETFDARRDARFYYLSIGLQAGLAGYMVASFFASVAYQWYVYYLVGYAICLRRIYEVEHGATIAARSPDDVGTEEKRTGGDGRVRLPLITDGREETASAS